MKDYNFDVAKETENCIKWIKDWFSNKGDKSKALIGISGGVDSSTTAALCVKALGKDRVIGIKLPCGKQTDIDYSNELIESLGIENYEINIGESYEALTRQMKVISSKSVPDTYSTNTPARIRMAAIYGVSAILGNDFPALPANTCNLSETSQGYDTIFGDSAGSFAPIAKFTKTEVRKIAKHLGLSEKLYNKVPIDGMSVNDDGSYKSDEDKLGFTYEELDSYLREGKVGKNNEKIVKGMKSTAWKRRLINIDHYEPQVVFFAKDLW